MRLLLLLVDDGKFGGVGWALAKVWLKAEQFPEEALLRLEIVLGRAFPEDMVGVAEAADVASGGIDAEDWGGAGAVAAHVRGWRSCAFRVLKVSNVPFSEISNNERNKIKAVQGTTLALIKNELLHWIAEGKLSNLYQPLPHKEQILLI
jgi:hypothetical protein